MTEYNHLTIEKKWQDFWDKHKTFKADNNTDKPTYYALGMFPFPSGAGLHVGHPEGYTATDILSRYKRMNGYEVLHPMGWDAFGLPTENYAIKTGIQPKLATAQNVANFTKQIKSLGFSYDWDREVNTTDPNYYKWTQDLFLKFYKKGLLYEENKPMNWCPSCKVVCANEEVENGLHERCGNSVEKKALKQWMFKITQYADRLLKDLENPNVVLIHGLGGNGNTGWQNDIVNFFKKEGITCLSPNFPNPNNPRYTEWKAFFEKEILPHINENTILFGHSLGGGFIQKYLSENDLKVSELVLVAPTVGHCQIQEIKNFFNQDFNYEKIKNSADNIFILAGGQDPYIKTSEFEFLVKKLNAHYLFNEKEEHFWGDFALDAFISTNLAEICQNIADSKLDWPEKIKAMQRNWIGKSSGIEITYKIDGFDDELVCYTTRPDTNFGATFLVLAPEHKFLVDNLDKFPNKDAVKKYIQVASKKSDIDRMAEGKVKTGVNTGIFVISQLTGEKLPLYVGDFVLANVGTGAVIGVPGHDQRDFEFAQAMGNIEIKRVVSQNGDTSEITEISQVQEKSGTMINSQFLDGLEIMDAKEKIMDYMEEQGFGKRVTNFRLRDWIFTRQRYWGEPIPLISCKNCGIIPHDPEFAKYPQTEEKRGSLNGHSNGASTSPLYSKRILASLTKSVKFIKNNGDYLSNIKQIIPNKIGEIEFNGEALKLHFQKNKNKAEQRERANFAKTISKQLAIITDWFDLESNKIGFLRAKGKIIQIVITPTKNQTFFVKTYYISKNITQVWKLLNKTYQLPLTLPETENYQPSDSGESPLAKITSWVTCQCPQCEASATRETSTMPNWAGSSWYWLRYMDAQNSQAAWSQDSAKKWGSVDLYVGGAEHAVLHLLYGRFWHKALYDMGLVTSKEPFKKLVNQGLILSHAYQNKNGGLIPVDEVIEKDGKFFAKDSGEELKKIVAKMSKSLKNVVNPDDIVQQYGADTLRMYEMFMGPFEQNKAWSTESVEGMYKFLTRIWRFFMEKDVEKFCPSKELVMLMHQTIKKVTEDIEDFKFNTAISQLMIWMNAFSKLDKVPLIAGSRFIRLLAPFAPHMAEEIWHQKFRKESKTITFEKWPKWKAEYLESDDVTYAIQINGKVRDNLTISKTANKEEVLTQAKKLEKIKNYLSQGEVKKEIFVPNKIIGFVVK